MKAIRIHSFGTADVLQIEDIPHPQIKSDEVLVEVHAAGINPLDWKVRAGSHPISKMITFPTILGWDVAGIIVDVGSQVTNFKVGDEIYARTWPGGAYAEYQAVKAEHAALKPKTCTFVEAASLPMVALTTWQAIVDVANVGKKDHILIHAAAGGCGTFAVQLAKARGAYVIGTASENNRDFLKTLGVDEFINYKAVNFEDVVSDVDIVYDTIGGETQTRSWQTLKHGGVLVSVVRPEPNPQLVEKYKVSGHLVIMESNGSQLTEVAQLVDADKIKPIVSHTYTFNEVRLAHHQIESGHTRGKIVIQVK